jgi:hypothetical protein
MANPLLSVAAGKEVWWRRRVMRPDNMVCVPPWRVPKHGNCARNLFLYRTGLRHTGQYRNKSGLLGLGVSNLRREEEQELLLGREGFQLRFDF